ncbi:PilZ domain-containing protein [Aliirhizobium smilacinae]|uniref:PilZ domain-containing protein n=1 Tax=Aliirhizobium smilacinae TaxID=1395944 RepID=A0A5C4XTW2_9HYPH|nr:PilZ domain-containing protein [Rhizobium smilacinae]
MVGKFSRGFLTLSLVAGLSSCNSASQGLDLSSNAASANAQPVQAVVQAYCPQVVMRDQNAVYRSYAKGGQDNPDKLLYQVSFNDSTRQCTANETTITINLIAQGRVVQGPAGTPGSVSLPILVEVVDGDNIIYSQKVAYPVDVPVGGTQFIFSKADVQIPNNPGGASRFTRVRLGFDNAPAAKKPRRS